LTRREIKEKAVLLKGSKCQCCKKKYAVVCYDFHHVDPSTKSFSIGSASTSWKIVEPELEKCQLLCATCHRLVEAGIPYVEPKNYTAMIVGIIALVVGIAIGMVVG
jgi:hypothetical protein